MSDYIPKTQDVFKFKGGSRNGCILARYNDPETWLPVQHIFLDSCNPGETRQELYVYSGDKIYKFVGVVE